MILIMSRHPEGITKETSVRQKKSCGRKPKSRQALRRRDRGIVYLYLSTRRRSRSSPTGDRDCEKQSTEIHQDLEPGKTNTYDTSS